jgi:hypothetical protein
LSTIRKTFWSAALIRLEEGEKQIGVEPERFFAFSIDHEPRLGDRGDHAGGVTLGGPPDHRGLALGGEAPNIVGLKWATPRTDAMEFEDVTSRFAERLTIIDNNLFLPMSAMPALGARAFEVPSL